MKLIRFAPLVLMVIYSLMLVRIELGTSQDHVRHYFTDIEGPVPLYAINTTLSTFLLWASALLFAVVLLALPETLASARERWFCLSQIAIFGYLGFDDRFLVHEHLSGYWPFHDALILVLIGVVEAAALLFLGDLPRRSWPARLYVVAAGVLFLVMAGIDAFVDRDRVLRLTLEDLAKVWAAWFLFLFSWQVLTSHVARLRLGAADRV